MNLFQRLHTTIHRRVWILSKNLLRHEAAVDVSGLHMRFLEPDMLDAYTAFRPDQREKASIRLREGHRAVLVCDGDRIVGAVWAATGRAYIPYLDRDILLDAREIYTYDAFTLPEYRRRGIATIRNSFLAPEYRRLGYDRAAAIVAFENHVGLRSAEAAGYERVGEFFCVRFGIGQIDFAGANPSGDQVRFAAPVNRRGG
jgi:GNAT superfamily N-acetyltransferase